MWSVYYSMKNYNINNKKYLTVFKNNPRMMFYSLKWMTSGPTPAEGIFLSLKYY